MSNNNNTVNNTVNTTTTTTTTTADLVNLTPHEVNLVLGDTSVSIPPSGEVARVKMKEDLIQTLYFNGVEVQVKKPTFGQVEGLPDPKDGVFYIVSAMVKSAAKERQDLLSPGGLVRGPDGSILGCSHLLMGE